MFKFLLISAAVSLMATSCGSTTGADAGTQSPTDTSSTTQDASSDDAASTDQPTDTDTNDTDTNDTDTDIEAPSPPEPASRAITFSPNDVSILFPAPKTQSDLNSKVIRLTDFQSNRVLTESQFQQVMQLVTGTSTLTTPNGSLQVNAGEVPGTGRRINFPGDNRRRDWAIAGVRIDPGAPGLGADTFNVFGKSPQIRLILQPVNQVGSTVKITDGSLHLVYAFHGPDNPAAVANCILHNTPDMTGFESAVNDLVDLKTRFETDHGVRTEGTPLGIHPAFSTAGPEFRTAMKDYLDTHLTTDRLFAVSVAGIPLPAPEPWVFLAMQTSPLSGNIEAVPGPAIVQGGPAPNFGQMISFIDSPQIVPAPATRNQQAVDCRLNRPGTVPQQAVGAGVSTAMAFDQGASNISSISARIADTGDSHFFNTDCVSCHTETRKEIDMGRASAQSIGAQFGIDPNVIPKEQWNVRAFGWFPGFFNQLPSGAHETVTRRTATETAEVIECFATDNWHKVNQSCLP